MHGYHTRVTPLVDGMSYHFVDFICLFVLFESLFVLLFCFLLFCFFFSFFPSSFCFRGRIISNPSLVLQVPYGYSNTHLFPVFESLHILQLKQCDNMKTIVSQQWAFSNYGFHVIKRKMETFRWKSVFNNVLLMYVTKTKTP